MVIYLGFSKVIIPKDLKRMYVKYKDREICLSDQECEWLKTILAKERGHIILNRNYTYNDRVLVIVSEKKQTELYFGVSEEGDEAIKIDKGFFEVELDPEAKEKYKSLIGIEFSNDKSPLL